MLPNDDIKGAKGHIVSEDVIVSNVSGHMLHNHGVIGARGHITREENIVCNASGHNVSNVDHVNVGNASGHNVSNVDNVNVDNASGHNVSNVDNVNVGNASGHNVSNVDNENVYNASGQNVSNVGNVKVCNASGHNVPNIDNANEKKQVVSQVTNEGESLTKAEVCKHNLTNNDEIVLNLKYKGKNVSKLFEVSMSLNGQPKVDLLVDTGASCTIIKSSCINKSVLETTKINLLSASGNPLSVKGCMNVNFEAKGESHQMQVVVVDDDTPFKQKGLLGADFLRRTQAILDLDKKTLKFKSVTLPLKERNDVSTNMVSCCQVEYDFDKVRYNAKSVKDVTVYANSQRIIQASVSHNNSKGEAALPPADQCYVTVNRSMGKIPLVIARSLDQLHSGTDQVNVMIMNPTNKDVNVSKGMHLTMLTPVPNYQKVVYSDGKSGPMHVISAINEGKVKPKIDPEMIQVDEHFMNYKDELVTLLNKYRNNVSIPGEPPGRTKLIKHKIILDTKRPLYTPQYRVPNVHQKALDNEIEEMLRDDVIRESKSPYNSPLVIVPKPDGSIRPCVDFRNVNTHVVPDRFPLPILGEVLQSLAGNDIFSTLDCQSGFWQVELEEESKPITAFSTRKGHYEYNVLPFGLKDAAPSFERMITMTLSGLINNTVLVYLDDVIVFSEGPKEHLNKLEKVLQRFQETGLTLKLTKCSFMRQQIKYLGHNVSKDGVSMDPGKVNTIQAYVAPKDKEGVKSFLGILSYYRSFIPSFSTRAQPLLKLVKKDQKFYWGEEQETAFQNLKKLLLEAPILRYPDFNKTFFLATDASDGGLGAALLQECEGKLHPISYASRTLNKAERNYFVTKKEALAIVWALRHYKYVILGYPIVVITDHKPLLAIFRKVPPDALMSRWMVLVQEYCPHIRHIPGKTNILADVLSRDCDVKVVSEGQAEDEVLVEQIHLVMSRDTNTNLWTGTPWQDESLAFEQQRDPFFAPILESFDRQCDKTEDDVNLSAYFVDEEILYKFIIITRLGVQQKLSVCCVPKIYLEASCRMIHQFTNHAAFDRCLIQAQKLIYHPDMKACLKSVIKECLNCIQVKGKLPSVPLHHAPIAKVPFEVIHIDFMGPVPEGTQLNKYVLVIVDQLTRYIVAVPTTNRAAETVVLALQKNIFAIYNVPKIIIADNAAEFTGELMENMAKVYSITLRNSTPYHPEGNGLAERSVKKVLQSLKLFCQIKPTWDLILPELVGRINSTFNSTVSDTSHYALYGFDRRTPFSNHTTPLYSERLEGINELARVIKQFVYEAVSDNSLERTIERNVGIMDKILYKGQRCFIHKSAVPGKYDKLDPTFVGPYIVKEAVSINSYQIVDPLSGKIKTLHRNKLIPAGILMSETEEKCESEGSESEEVEMPRRKRKVIPTSDRVLRSQQTL